jgi:hypothetical protein
VNRNSTNETAMKLDFRTVAMIAALVCFVLTLVWLLSPNLLLSIWAVEFSYAVGLVGRRGAALFAGIGVMLFQVRNTEPSPARSALVTGFVVGCLMLALLGTFEFATGHAGPGILFAVFVEIALACAFLFVERHVSTFPNTEASS